MTTNLNERFIKSVGRHFVTLSCVQTLADGRTEKALVFSGFLVDVNGVWFYVTAGHILRKIKAAQNAGIKFDIWRLGDQTAGNRFRNIAIPVDFDVAGWLVIENEENGLDYAAVGLRAMYCELLMAGDAAPIDKTAWGNHVAERDRCQWALVGIPSESVLYDGKTLIHARVVVAPVTPLDEPPLGAGERAQNQFFGRLKDDSDAVLKDVDGMSGGPIFALKKVDADTWKYKVIGVQSGWYRSNRIISACPFSSFGLALEDVVAEARAILAGEGA